MLSLLLIGCNNAQDQQAVQSRAYHIIYIGNASRNESEGLYCAKFYPDSGNFEFLHQSEGLLSPGYLTISPQHSHLYRIHGVKGQKEGGISAFAIDPASYRLSKLNQVSTAGRGPCYVSFAPSGDLAYVANYSSGSISVIPIQEDGSLAEVSQIIQHEGASINQERQKGPHAHYIESGAHGFVYAADLGIDKVMVYESGQEPNRLIAAHPSSIKLVGGLGPRHIDFHPGGEYIYVMNELVGSVSGFLLNKETKEFEEIQTISSLPSSFEGYNKSADIHVHPSGRFLYASNRGDLNSIAVFSIEQESGLLELVEVYDEGIAWPRNFNISPDGGYLLVCNRDNDEVISLQIDLEKGSLSPTGHSVYAPKPICVKFLK